MNIRSHWLKPVGIVTTAMLVLAACSGSSSPTPGGPGGQIGGTVSVLGSWTGSEQESFMAMMAPFEQQTGVKVEYTGTRDLTQQLTTGVASGNLPDVAGLPGPGPMAQWYASGSLKALDFVDFAKYESETPPGFAAAGKAADGKLVGIFTKAAVKGLIWHRADWTGEPATWDELKTMAASAATGSTKQWCVGVESGATSGWPGTDWIEDIILRQSGPEVYDKWVRGEQKWTSAEIKSAYETLGEVLTNSHGGPDYIVNTAFGKAANPMFDDPPGCLLHHQASFITDFFKSEAAAEPADYGFFVMPDINTQFTDSITTAGDLFGMFNPTPQAQALIQYLLTPAAQEIWVKRGGFISMNKNVPVASYPDDASRTSAEILQAAKNAKFDASDLMPAAMADAFNSSIVDYAGDQTKLDAILADLDTTQADAYSN